MAETKNTGMVAVMHYFGMKVGEFRKEWAELSEKDKKDLTSGIDSGTLTY